MENQCLKNNWVILLNDKYKRNCGSGFPIRIRLLFRLDSLELTCCWNDSIKMHFANAIQSKPITAKQKRNVNNFTNNHFNFSHNQNHTRNEHRREHFFKMNSKSTFGPKGLKCPDFFERWCFDRTKKQKKKRLLRQRCKNYHFRE